jgi:hypothetical protein
VFTFVPVPYCFVTLQCSLRIGIVILPALLFLLRIAGSFVFHMNFWIFLYFCGECYWNFDVKCIESVYCFCSMVEIGMCVWVWGGVSLTFCLGWPWTVILPIFASWEARSKGMRNYAFAFADRDSLTSSFLICVLFTYFSYLTTLAKNSSTIMNKIDNSGPWSCSWFWCKCF